MIAGVGRAKGIRNAEPDEVARAVAGVIAKPKPRVFVPRSIGRALAVQRLMPRRVKEATGRATRASSVFTTDVDVDKRTAYARRAGTS
jgi:hypothetical protein